MNWLKQKLLWLRAELCYRITGKTYDVVLTPEMEKQLAEMDEKDREIVRQAIEKLKRNPYAGRIYEEFKEAEDISELLRRRKDE